MIRTNVWSPDTCDCKIIYQWDDSLPQDQWVFEAVEETVASNGEIIKRHTCQAHITEAFNGKHKKHMAKVLDENQRKNVVLGKLKEIHGENFEADWAFDQDRKLVITTKTRKLSKIEEGVLKARITKTFADGVIFN